jgi:hypothetical protein
MSLRAKRETRRKQGTQQKRHRIELLWRYTIWFASVPILSLALSHVPKLSGLAWLRPLYEVAGLCDGIAFFVFMYLQFVFDRTEILEPTRLGIEANKRLLEDISYKLSQPNEIQGQFSEILSQLGRIGNTRWLPNKDSFMGRLMADLGAAASESSQPKPTLRLLRLSGHWKMNENLIEAAAVLEKMFDTDWEVQLVYAVDNKEAVDALLEDKSILGRVLSQRPKNYTFKLIARQAFEPSIGMAIINEDVVFVSFDVFTDDPFPDQGLVIHGDPIKWYLKWFEEMFKAECSVTVYERSRPLPSDGLKAVLSQLAEQTLKHWGASETSPGSG